MTTRLVLMVSGAIEAATGVSLILAPEIVARVLLGAVLSDAGVAVARVAGVALLSLAVACWPGRTESDPEGIRGMFVYNLLAGLYLGYLRVGGGFAGYLLWPACFLHVVIALLLARRTFRKI